MEQLGAGELIIQSIDRDGQMSGYDLKLVRRIADAVSIPVVALGGAGFDGRFQGSLRERSCQRGRRRQCLHIFQAEGLGSYQLSSGIGAFVVISNRHYQQCVRCVMDTSDPEIRFDADGVWNHFHRVVRQANRLEGSGEAGPAHLPDVIRKIKKAGRGRKYDAILSISGGVDSRSWR